MSDTPPLVVDSREALAKALHDERTANKTLNVDCWACEAAQSETVTALIAKLRRAEAAASHVNAVLERAVPQVAAQKDLWRAHWAQQLELRSRSRPEESGR